MLNFQLTSYGRVSCAALNLDFPKISTVDVDGSSATSKEGCELSTDIQLDTNTCLPFPLATAGKEHSIIVCKEVTYFTDCLFVSFVDI